MINEELKKYIETNIFPKYEEGSGHGLGHIKDVIERSIKFAKQVESIDYNMCYAIAAYHDIGRKIDNATHEIISAKILLEDKKLKQFFSEDKLKIMAEAVEDHRASLKREPRSIYGKIVSSADRTISVDTTTVRAVEYLKSLNPNESLDEIVEKAAKNLLEKFGPNGYGLSKMYFHNPDFEKACKDIAKLAENPKLLKQHYIELTA